MADSYTQGLKWLFYVNAGGAPGTDPDLVASYTKVGLLISESGTTSNDTVEVRHKDSGGYRTVVPTTLGSEITISGYLCADGQAGHTILRAAKDATALASKKIGWISSTGVSTTEFQDRGEAYVIDYTWSRGTDEMATWECTLSVIGAITTEAVPA